VDSDPTRPALVAGLHQFTHSTGSELIGEGIERPEELHVLHDLGVELGQGYLLGRPT
jgi:EAL domain-containing protein (putative c-di-GMP-specific phosphodiesterase class I)